MTEDELLSKAYGELARGFKRLRNVHQARVRDRNSPDSAGAGISVPDDPGSGLSVPRLAQTRNPNYVWRPRPPSGLGTENPDEPEPPRASEDPLVVDFFEVNYGIKALAFELPPQVLLTSARTMAFGKNFPQFLMKSLLSGRVRGGMAGNYWVADPTQTRGWRRIGATQMRGVLHMLENYHSSCNLLIHAHQSHAEFVKNVGPLPHTKWNRRSFITDSELTWEGLRQFARDEHRRLPSVCARLALS